MHKEIFKSKRHFTIFDFDISHGQLLLRASKDDDNINNIDIIFFGTRYIQLITSLLGVSIRLANDNQNLNNYNSLNSISDNLENHLFEINSTDESFYIGASYFKVYENELEFKETSLGLFEVKGRDKEVARS